MGREKEGIFHREIYFWYLASFPIKSNGEKKSFAGEKITSLYLALITLRYSIWKGTNGILIMLVHKKHI